MKKEEGEERSEVGQWGGKGAKAEVNEKQEYMLRLRLLEGKKREQRKESELGWDKRGWTGSLWPGRYVGCPELPDGCKLISTNMCVRTLYLLLPYPPAPLPDFRSVVIEVYTVTLLITSS